MITIYLDNFDLPTTTKVIQDTKRCYLIQQIPLLYKITNGNPLELEHTLRFPDEKIRAILQREILNDNSFQEDTFTTERVAELYYQKPIYAVILNILQLCGTAYQFSSSSNVRKKYTMYFFRIYAFLWTFQKH